MTEGGGDTKELCPLHLEKIGHADKEEKSFVQIPKRDEELTSTRKTHNHKYNTKIINDIKKFTYEDRICITSILRKNVLN